MSASVAATIETREDAIAVKLGDQRWHPARRAAAMVVLGALAWIPVIAAGRLILS